MSAQHLPRIHTTRMLKSIRSDKSLQEPCLCEKQKLAKIIIYGKNSKGVENVYNN